MIFRGSKSSGPIRDEDIHAYADGLLDAARCREVEQHLAAHPGDAERIAQYRRVNAGLAELGRRVHDPDAAFAAIAQDLSEAIVRQRQFRRTLGGMAASLLLLAAASGTWMLAGPTSSGSDQAVKTAAVAPASSGTPSDHFVEISGGTEKEVTNWLSERVDPERFSAPDLSAAGFKLTGARVVVTPEGPLVQMLYRDGKEGPLTFSVSVGEIARPRSALGDLSDRQLAVYWRQGPLVYSLLGPMRHADLATLADLVAGGGAAKTAKAIETAAAPKAVVPENSGVVLIDSKPQVTANAESEAASERSTSGDDTVKAPPPASAEKVEEPKPL